VIQQHETLNAIFVLLVSIQAASAQISNEDQVLKYTGARVILRWDGSADQKITAKDLPKLASVCDIAIEIRKAKLDKNQLRFEYARAGLVLFPGRPAPRPASDRITES